MNQSLIGSQNSFNPQGFSRAQPSYLFREIQPSL
jgi:hypothetical protein